MASSTNHHLVLLCLLLVAPHFGSAYHSSYRHGARHVVVRSSDHDSRAPFARSAIPSGDGVLPITHRHSVDSDRMPTMGDIFNNDALRLRTLTGSSFETTIPSTSTPLGALPGGSEYHVTVGYGTPAQNITVGFDTAAMGATLLQCKPCAGGAPCDKGFDPSRSSSLAQVPCGSQDCPFKACSGATCTIAVTKEGTVLVNATFVKDTLTVTPSSIPVNDLRVACLEMGTRTVDSSSGVLDLSRERHSLASRVILSPQTAAFSYCLTRGTKGFLSFNTTRPEGSVTYATLQSNTSLPNLYFLKLASVGLGRFEIPVPPTTTAGDTLLEVHTTFTYLKPDTYAALRDKFRWSMRQYVMVPPSGELDTCYDFTHLNEVEVPAIIFMFEGGGILDLGIDQMMYSMDPGNIFSVACLAFAPLPAYAPGAAVIGSLAQGRTEVVYDLLGGKLGFVPDRC